MVAFLTTEPAQRETIQFISLSISLLSAGYAVASTDRALDMGKTRRRTDPHLFGYVPSVADGAFWQLFAMVVFFASYMVAKMFALALLVTAGGAWLVAVWFMTEFGLLLGVRVAIGNWRFFRRGVDGVGISVLLHFCLYIGLLAAPFPLLRNPVFLTSRVYSGGLLYMLLVNFAQVGIAYRHFGGSDTVDETTAWAILFSATAACVISGTVAYRYVPETHKRTFYEHRTFKQYVETFWWTEARHGFDHKGRVLDTQEGQRARLPLWVPDHYLPKEKCKAFYEENWARWESEQPEWFDNEFKKLVPRELLPSLMPTTLPSLLQS